MIFSQYQTLFVLQHCGDNPDRNHAVQHGFGIEQIHLARPTVRLFRNELAAPRPVAWHHERRRETTIVRLTERDGDPETQTETGG